MPAKGQYKPPPPLPNSHDNGFPNREQWDELAKIFLDLPDGLYRMIPHDPDFPELEGSVAESAIWGWLSQTESFHKADKDMLNSAWGQIFFKHWFHRRGYRVSQYNLENALRNYRQIRGGILLK